MSRIAALIGVLVLAAAGWSGWWWLGAEGQRRAVEGWLAERRAAGWVAEAGVGVSGYPNRLDMTVSDLRLADPEAGWAWAAPEFRTYMLSYAPNRAIAQWPGAHVISVPGERVEARAERFRASVAFAPDTQLALQRAVVEAEALDLTSALGWRAGLASGQLSVRSSAEARGRANAYDAVLDGAGLRPPDFVRAIFGAAAGGGLPDAMETVRLDATAAFARPLDRAALEASDLRTQVIWLRPSELRWGALRLEASGRLDMDAEGVPTGTIDLRAENWRAMFDAAVSAGALDDALARTLRTGLELVAMLSSDRDALEAPLRFARGSMFLGPIPLGPAPRF